MQNLRVDPAGLTTFATSLGARAGVLRSSLAAEDAPGPVFQATSASIASSDSKIHSACETLARRVEDMSAKVLSTAETYQSRDQHTAVSIRQTIGPTWP